MKPSLDSQFDDAQIEKLLVVNQPEVPSSLRQLTINGIRSQTQREKKQFFVTSFLAFTCFGLWLNVVLILGMSSASGIALTTMESQQSFEDILKTRQNLFDRLDNL